MLKEAFFIASLVFLSFLPGFSQQKDGIIEGVLIDSVNRQPLTGASIELQSAATGTTRSATTDKFGLFSFDALSDGYYTLTLTFTGFSVLRIDSLHIYSSRKEILLGELLLKAGSTLMDEVVIYAEKPMIQTKDGNIVLNVAESPLSAGSNASDLLKTMPLVTTDPDGRVSVRGREPRILIDEKPIELNGQQLSDFLESLPGGMVEKIELMSNPPPQFANEPGGVINIITRKGKVGFTGRSNLYTGSRGEAGVNNSLNYRRKGLVISFNAGVSMNTYKSISSGYRQNFYKDSTNSLRTSNNNINKSTRPNLSLNIEYDHNARNNVGVQLMMNGNDGRNNGVTTYRNFNASEELYRFSERNIGSDVQSWNPSAGVNWQYKGKKAGERLRIFLNGSFSDDQTDKDFLHQYFNGSGVKTGPDSTQAQYQENRTFNWSGRIAYDKPLGKGKTILATSFSRAEQESRIAMDTYYENAAGMLVLLPIISSDLLFQQQISSSRLGIRQTIRKGWTITSGAVWEVTGNSFDIYSQQKKTGNRYENLLPYLNSYMQLPSDMNVNFSYRKAIRRPGIRELNPAVDYTDPINIRFGNAELSASPSHNFDLTAGISKSKIYGNIGLGYNIVDNIFAPVRLLVEGGKTNITWQNISAKQEYEVSGWMGMEVVKGFRVNLNGEYNFSRYSEYDIRVNKYRNGASVNSKLNFTYVPAELWNVSANLGYNRFANPQGTVRSNVSMHFATQRKFFNKKLVMAMAVIDPFIQQGYNNTTVGSNFRVNSIGTTQTRNLRISATYLFNVRPVRPIVPGQGKI